MATEFGRNARVSSQIQKELALVFQRDINDLDLGLITINEVEISHDLAVAKIYITLLNNISDSKKVQVQRLNKRVPTIRHYLAKRMRLRHIAELRFFYDDSLDKSLRISQLLQDKLIEK
jgi:ribosome-binding factor A